MRMAKAVSVIGVVLMPGGEEVGGGDREQGQQERPGQQFGHPEQSQLGQEHLGGGEQRRPGPRPSPRSRATPIATSGALGSAPAIPHGRNRFASSASSTVSRIAGGPFDQRKARSGVFEDHRLVHHRQLQVCGRVVDGQPAGFGDDHDHQRHEGQQPAGRDTACAGCVDGASHDGAEVGRPGRDGQREHREQDRGLDQGGDGDLAAGAHPAERGAGVDAGQSQRDGAQEQQPDDGEQVGDRVQRRAGRDQRQRRATISSVVPASMAGAAANTMVVPCGVICCLRSCLRRSRHGCITPPPARPSSRARTCRVIPITTGAPSATPPICAAPARYGHRVHRATTSTIRTPERAVGEVEMHAAGVRAANTVGAQRAPRGSPAV